MTRQVDVKALVSHIVRGDGTDKCRICMGDTSEGQVHLEDTVMMDGDKPVTLAELLHVITGVQVERSPRMPNKVCGPCSKDITLILPFINLCIHSAKQWTRISDYMLNLTVPSNTRNVYIRIDKDIEMLKDTTRGQKPKINNRKEALKRFKTRLYRKINYKTRVEKKNRKDFKIKCPKCRCQYVNLFKFNKHIANFKKKMCGQCFKVIDVNAFESHAKSHNIDIFCCHICFASFEREAAFMSHRRKHEKGTVSCVECCKPFTNAKYLNTHMFKHKPVTCGCGKRLPNRTCFLNHKKKCDQHKNIKSRYVCDYCNKEYVRKNSLRVHIKFNHMVGRLHQCEECGKKFLSHAHLLEHGNTHSRVTDRFVCFCGAKYSTRRGYQRHYVKHH